MVSVAVITDVKTWKIPNWLVVAGIITGGICSVSTMGLVAGGKEFLYGVFAPIIILFILFLFRFVGAGDIKLFSAVGAFVGADIGQIMLYAFLSGGMISVLYIIREVCTSTVFHRKSPVLIFQEFAGAIHAKNHKIHFSLAIMMGYIWYLMGGVVY